MAHPIKELARLTTRSKQVDGMGFGGTAADNLEVAAALALADPRTGKKLPRQQYYLARLVYCDDKNARPLVKSALLGSLINEDTGKIAEITLIKLINAALREFQSPKYSKPKDPLEERTIQSYSVREISKSAGIDHKSLTERHKAIYDKLTETINVWSSDAIAHLRSHFDEVA